jgi:hypothetical protein
MTYTCRGILMDKVYHTKPENTGRVAGRHWKITCSHPSVCIASRAPNSRVPRCYGWTSWACVTSPPSCVHHKLITNKLYKEYFLYLIVCIHFWDTLYLSPLSIFRIHNYFCAFVSALHYFTKI